MTRHTLLRAGVTSVVALALVACGGAYEARSAPSAPPAYAPSGVAGGAQSESAPSQDRQQPQQPHDAPRTTAPQTTAPQNAKTTPAVENKAQPEATVASAFVIYTGSVTMTEDQEKIPALIERAIELAESQGGRLHARRDDGVQLRVPSARFRETMTKIDALGAVTHRSVTADDVSEEYHDAEVRLLNLKATRQRMQEFLARAQNMQEALTVEKELERISQEIDRLQGRMRFLSDRAAMSVIDIAIVAKPKPQIPIVTPPPPPPPPPPKGVELPIDWLSTLGTPKLTELK